MTRIVKPKRLKPNAVIGLVAPASPARSDTRLDAGIAYLESLGYRVKEGRFCRNSHLEYLAGTDSERVQDLEDMFTDPMVDAIFCVRGGYGVTRILQSIDYRLIAAHPKILVGFSDITALQAALLRHTGLITFSGAMVAVDFYPPIDAETEEFFWRMLTSTTAIGSVRQSERMYGILPGTARGQLICGNLCLLAALCGSQFSPSYSETILLIEEIGEEAYRIDRYLSQLKNSGALTNLAGYALGHFSPPANARAATPQPDVEKVLREYAAHIDRPCIGGVMYGHQSKKLTLPFGIQVEIDGAQGTLTLAEAAVV